MISAGLKEVFEQVLSERVGQSIKITSFKDLSGGCIHRALKAETSFGNFFIKYNHQQDIALFETEAKGLHLLKQTNVIDIPEVYAYGLTGSIIYLMLEFVEPILPKGNYWEHFGRSLANLHKISNDQYGLHFNNYIGSLPQKNKLNSDWLSFFIEERLEPQLKLACDTGKVGKIFTQSFQNFYKKLPQLIFVEKPSLLHGDLWSGNVLVNNKGLTSLIDPAVYYGHREAEIAFTQLFGGFASQFYASYKESFPLGPGYKERFDIDNLYPLMVHVNLFGGGYLNSVEAILRRYL